MNKELRLLLGECRGKLGHLEEVLESFGDDEICNPDLEEIAELKNDIDTFLNNEACE